MQYFAGIVFAIASFVLGVAIGHDMGRQPDSSVYKYAWHIGYFNGHCEALGGRLIDGNCMLVSPLPGANK